MYIFLYRTSYTTSQNALFRYQGTKSWGSGHNHCDDRGLLQWLSAHERQVYLFCLSCERDFTQWPVDCDNYTPSFFPIFHRVRSEKEIAREQCKWKHWRNELAVIFLIICLLCHVSFGEREEVLYNVAWKQILLDRIARFQSFCNADDLRVNSLRNEAKFVKVTSTKFLFRWLLSFKFFDFLMEQALKKVLLEYVRAMLNKYVVNFKWYFTSCGCCFFPLFFVTAYENYGPASIIAWAECFGRWDELSIPLR